MFTKNKNYLYLCEFALLIVLFFVGANKVFAATINFSNNNSYNVGDTVRVKLYIGTESKSINAVSANIKFSSNLLTLSSVSKSGSIISLWAQEPSFSNTNGTASFEGVVLSGYTGSNGNVVTLVFRAKSEGVASISFTNASILANDGNGTEVFSGNLITENIQINKAVNKEKIIEKTKEVEEKIKEIEITNSLPNNSLLFTVIMILVMIICLLIISIFVVIFKMKKYFKNRLLRTENSIYKIFKKLDKNINEENKEQKSQKSIKNTSILAEVSETEEEIIKEVEEVKNEI